MSRVLLALGGNAMTNADGRARVEDQQAAAAVAMAAVAELIETGVDVVEQTRQTMEAAAAKVAATIQDSKRARALAHGLRPQPAPATTPPPQHTQQPGIQHAPGRNPGGVT